MTELGIHNITDAPYAPFLRALQSWVWRRFPVHQLSATDIFYALKWAKSGIPVSALTDHFDAWLCDHPHHFDDGFRLTRLKIQADHAIAEYRKKPASAPPLRVRDPYKAALDAITNCGKQTENPLLREALRTFYQGMRTSYKEATEAYPEWNLRAETFYPFKARAILAWDAHLDALLRQCFEMLSDQEQAQILTLNPQEKVHCMHLGDEAKQFYLAQCKNTRIAAYFHIEPLLENIL